jgi:hypothetical protein
MLQKVSAAAVRRVREHRQAGHRTIMITAAAEPFIRPLAPLFDVVIGARLEERDGLYTGYLAEPPLVGEARGAWLRRYAEREGADLKNSYAYADSHSDSRCSAPWATPWSSAGRRALRVRSAGAPTSRTRSPAAAAGPLPEAGALMTVQAVELFRRSRGTSPRGLMAVGRRARPAARAVVPGEQAIRAPVPSAVGTLDLRLDHDDLGAVELTAPVSMPFNPPRGRRADRRGGRLTAGRGAEPC